MKIKSLDHLVLTVADIDVTVDFYTRILGMEISVFGDNRKALRFGKQKINLHELGRELEPKAGKPTAGSADLCFVTAESPRAVLSHLARHGATVLEGPLLRTGAMGAIESVYVRDPDGNLIELSSYTA